MCNLNILIRNKKNKNKLVTPFLMAVTSASFKNNNDGEGIYFNKLVKNFNKINLFKHRDNINKNNIILTHQRYTTSGFNKKYLQPFESEDFVFMHNGVINDYDINKASDTYNLFKEFKKTFKSYKTQNRDKKIIKTIKKIFDKLNGRWSITLLDKKTNLIYYFKEGNTNINFYKNHDFIYISTTEENKVFLKMLKTEFKTKKIKPYNIYKINYNDLSIKKIAEIEKNKNNYCEYYTYNVDLKSNKNKQLNSFIKESKKTTIKTHGAVISGSCELCNTKTNNYDFNNSCYLCLNCQDYYSNNYPHYV